MAETCSNLANRLALGKGQLCGEPPRVMTVRPRLLSLLVIGAVLAFASAPATRSAWAAEDTAATADAAATKQLEALLATLQDEGARKAFIEKLRALLAARKATAEPVPAKASGVLGALAGRLDTATKDIVALATLMVDAPRLWRWVREQLADPAARARWIEAAWKISLVFGLALLAEWLARILLARPRRAVEGRAEDRVLVRLPFLLARTLLDLLPIAAFAAAAYGAIPFIDPSFRVGLVLLTVIYANVLARAVISVARMILVPRAVNLRVLPIPDRLAAYLFIWTRRVGNTAIYGIFLSQALLQLGLPEAGYNALIKLIGFAIAALLVVLVMQNRETVAAWIAGTHEEGGGGLRARFADIWHVLAILYLAAAFAVWALDVDGGFAFLARASAFTAAIALLAGFAALGVRRWVAHMLTASAELTDRYPGLEGRVNRYLPMIRTLLHGFIVVVAALAVLEAWNLQVLGWLTEGAGRRILGSAVSIVIIVLGALLLWEVLSAVIERYLARVERDSDPTRSARLRTLLPLSRKAMAVALVVFVSLIVLSELGIDIAPLLAGAGVVGLAIGFGAQTLVKDVITGLFILVEDTIAVGDVVDVAGYSGVVEDLSIRSIRMRDYSGIVYSVPFSEVSTVRNFTKDFSHYVFEVGIAYRENVDEVIALLGEIGEEMRADADYGKEILAPLDVAGLDKFGDSAVIIKARLKTKAGSQWRIGREFNRRMKAAFDARGIEMPFPHVTLYFGEDKAGNAPPAYLRLLQGDDKPAPAAAAPSAPAAKPAPPPRRSAEDEKTAHLPGEED